MRQPLNHWLATILFVGLALYTELAFDQAGKNTILQGNTDAKALLQRADTLYGQRNYAAALPLYKQAAGLGQGHASMRVGFFYDQGLAVKKDFKEAMLWYRKAADAGDATALAWIGGMYLYGRGVPVDYPEALAWIHRAIDQGDTAGMNLLGSMYAAGQGVPKSPTDAFEWYRKAAELGEMYAMNNLAIMYLGRSGVPGDDAEAFRWYRKAAELGQDDAMVSLGIVYEHGELGQPKNPTEALRWYRKASDLGNQNAKQCLARFGRSTFDLNGDWEGYFSTPTIPEAIRITQEGGKITATRLFQETLSPTGLPFFKGTYDGHKLTGQVEVAQYASLLGLLSAMHGIATGTPSPPAAWFPATLYIEDPDHIHVGNTPAFQRVSPPPRNDLPCNWTDPVSNKYRVKALWAYFRGLQWLQDRDYRKAACWLMISASQAHPLAMTDLGILSLKGLGAPPNYIDAVDYFQAGAKLGDYHAAVLLADMYERGQGIPPNPEKAASWRKKGQELKAAQDKRELAEKQSRDQQWQGMKGMAALSYFGAQVLGRDTRCDIEYSQRDIENGTYERLRREREAMIASGELDCSGPDLGGVGYILDAPKSGKPPTADDLVDPLRDAPPRRKPTAPAAPPVPAASSLPSAPSAPAVPASVPSDRVSRSGKAVLEQKAIEIATLLGNNQFDAVYATYTPEMKKVGSPQRMAGFWNHQIQQFGPFVKILATQKNADADIVNVVCGFQNGQVNVEVVFDPSLRVNGLWIQPAPGRHFPAR